MHLLLGPKERMCSSKKTKELNEATANSTATRWPIHLFCSCIPEKEDNIKWPKEVELEWPTLPSISGHV
jgi:hypothetical protein